MCLVKIHDEEMPGDVESIGAEAGCDNSRTNVPEVRQIYGLVLLCF